MNRKDFEAIFVASDAFKDFYTYFSSFSKKAKDITDNSKERLEWEKESLKSNLDRLKNIKSVLTNDLVLQLARIYARFLGSPNLIKETTYDGKTTVDIDCEYLKSQRFEDLVSEISNDINCLMNKYKLSSNNIKDMNLVVEATAAKQLEEMVDILNSMPLTDFNSDSPIIFETNIKNLEMGCIKLHNELTLKTFRKLIRNKDGHILAIANSDLTTMFLGSNQPDIHEKCKNITGKVGTDGVIYLNVAKVPREYFHQIDETIDTKKKVDKKLVK